MNVPFVDLGRLPAERDAAVRDAVLRVLDHRRFILGPEVLGFERAMADRVDGAHVIGVSSGTDALLLALMALDVGPGDRIVTTPFSFFATAGVVARLGARPVFVDIEPRSFGLDASGLADVERTDVKAIIPVHLFGDVIDLDPIAAWAGPGVAVLEDAAQAIGAVDVRDRVAGTIGAMGTFSFFPTKNLGACGDAGMVVTRDDGLAARLRRLRGHGQTEKYLHAEIGGNFRLDAMQAAALAASLPWLDELQRARRRNAERYLDAMTARGLGERVVLPRLHERHTAHQFVVRVPGGRRDDVLAGLRECGIGAAVYYPHPFHLQPCFAYLGYGAGDFPEAERAAQEVLALPIFPGLTEPEQTAVVAALDALV
ncbi:MAG: transcriptional regulator [Deltaproteobacteria bacterium]|nr:transcriptional regulator [Deltaproteobacteria bacterium]